MILCAALLAAAFLALAVALKFYVDVGEDDLEIVRAIALHRTALGISVATFLSAFGETLTLVALSVLATIVFHLAKRRAELLGFSVSILGALVSITAFKEIIERARPDVLLRAIAESGFSFPSGHATISAVFYGWLGYLLLRRTKSRLLHILIAVGITVLILSIGFSRIYLGVHYPTDIAAGFSLGLFWLLIGRFIVHRRQELSTP